MARPWGGGAVPALRPAWSRARPARGSRPSGAPTCKGPPAVRGWSSRPRGRLGYIVTHSPLAGPCACTSPAPMADRPDCRPGVSGGLPLTQIRCMQSGRDDSRRPVYASCLAYRSGPSQSPGWPRTRSAIRPRYHRSARRPPHGPATRAARVGSSVPSDPANQLAARVAPTCANPEGRQAAARIRLRIPRYCNPHTAAACSQRDVATLLRPAACSSRS